ncbi:MAG: DNA-3-methyladenine glycosylase [Candidatus Moranbacteria bacterium]|nr:DNA-3-methyladenine glycosylase [Candidatus Moranbacteria bacterium]
MVLKRKFYNRNTLQTAQDLLGCFLVRKIGRKTIRAMITDVEAYVGEDDLASHASKGRTPRTEMMYGAAGHAYVYLVYGMHNVMNVVTEKKNFPAAVMLRGVKIGGVDYAKTNGPGKLCKVLAIDRRLNGHDLTKGEKLWIERGEKIKKENIKTGKRIGIDYARHCKHYLWRFYIDI